jgi:hypothetical protein
MLFNACSTTREAVPTDIPNRITPIANQPGLVVTAGSPTASPGAGTPVATPKP